MEDGGFARFSATGYSCAHGAQINFGDLTPYLPHASDTWTKCFRYSEDGIPVSSLLSDYTFLFNCVIFVLCFARRDVKIEKGEDANVLDAAAKVNKQFPDTVT
jgi:hypothetical protein